MNKSMKCETGSCDGCIAIGNCPQDHEHCEDCGIALEMDEGIEIEVEIFERGQKRNKAIKVCPDCYNKYSLDYDDFTE